MLNMKWIAVAVLAVSAPGWSQKDMGVRGVPVCIVGKTCPEPKQGDVKCGRFQHEEFIPHHCANTCDAMSMVCTTECRYVEAVDQCVDDMHDVTEREWRDLMARLSKLENPPTHVLLSPYVSQCQDGTLSSGPCYIATKGKK